MEFIYTIILVSAGFLAGLIDSVAGGGGLISIPALLATGLPAHITLGTNKFMSMFGTTAALLNFHRKAKIIWKIALVGVPFSLIGSVLGAKLALVIDSTVLAKVLVATLPPAAILMFASKALIKPGKARTEYSARFWAVTTATCFAIGVYDGFFGPGTGTFLIVALVIFSRMPLVNASATAKAFNEASNIGGLVTFILSGEVHYGYGIAMAMANIAGNYIGSHYAMKHGGPFIQKLVFVSMSLLFVYLVWKYYGGG